MNTAEEIARRYTQTGECPEREKALAGAIADATADLRTRLAALEGKWQPISTAPTDGTEFLGYWDNDDMHVVCIRNGECYRAMDREPWAMPLCWMPLPEVPAADALKAELEKSE